MPRKCRLVAFRDLDPTGFNEHERHRRLWSLRDALKELGRELDPLERRRRLLRKYRTRYTRLLVELEEAS